MRPGRNWATKEQPYLWQTEVTRAQAVNMIRFLWDTIGVSSMIVLEAHDIPHPGSGDLLEDRF
jgi:hypothetical protein